MVLKQCNCINYIPGKFENDVIWYGTQTSDYLCILAFLFENDVIWYGTQTNSTSITIPNRFENDVILNIKNSRQIHPTSCLYYI